MKIEFVDMQEKDNPLNGMLVENGQELAQILEKLRARQPFGLELIGENGFTLTICLAEKYGAVQHAATAGNPPYLLAVAPGSPPLPARTGVSPHTLAVRADQEKGLKSLEFLVGGTATAIPTRYCLPYELVKEIAVHFLQSGGRETHTLWEEI